MQELPGEVLVDEQIAASGSLRPRLSRRASAEAVIGRNGPGTSPTRRRRQRRRCGRRRRAAARLGACPRGRLRRWTRLGGRLGRLAGCGALAGAASPRGAAAAPRPRCATWNASSAARLGASHGSPSPTGPDRRCRRRRSRTARTRVRLRRRAAQPHPQAQDRQRHAAAAAELAALRPGRQPAAAQHGLILDVRRRHAGRRLQPNPSIQRLLPRSPIHSPSRPATSPRP